MDFEEKISMLMSDKISLKCTFADKIINISMVIYKYKYGYLKKSSIWHLDIGGIIDHHCLNFLFIIILVMNIVDIQLT